ncbi:CDP-alcohol phosphatidyltransferase family protein [Nioella aestuarii]|uniref:CDP-alcohol phosphatidyltransferase family protein n=1 Tax=Nioella aestuarii TaxID=1662864 RepID=UPI003D7FC349
MTPTIPNLMTLYRLAAAPAAAVLALAGLRDIFFAVIVLSLLSDLLDGPLARWLKQETSAGARLDTIADGGTVLAGLLGVYLFEGDSIRPDIAWLYVFLASYAGAAGISLVKFRTLPAFHLYSSKLAAVGSGVFFVWLFYFGYSRPVFITATFLGIVANIESMLVTLLIKRLRTDIHSVLGLTKADRSSTY